MTGETAAYCLLWLVGLGIALAASEALVQALGRLGQRVHLAVGLLGVLVALGADGPEVTSAIVALHAGSTEVGLGVVLGSNIYNLAGLLGFSALLAGALATGRGWMTTDMACNAAITVLVLVALEVPFLRAPAAALACIVFACFAFGVSTGKPAAWFAAGPNGGAVPESGVASATQSPVTLPALAAVLLVAVLAIVVGSQLLVEMSLRLGPRFGLPPAVVGTFVLAVATSLPNTWAAVSLTRRGQSAAAIAATFSSNSINLVAAVALPALVINLHAASTFAVDAWWLAGMTVAATLMLGFRHALSRVDGLVLLGLYGLFVVSRLLWA